MKSLRKCQRRLWISQWTTVQWTDIRILSKYPVGAARHGLANAMAPKDSNAQAGAILISGTGDFCTGAGVLLLRRTPTIPANLSRRRNGIQTAEN
jgi:hypothetical protein